MNHQKFNTNAGKVFDVFNTIFLGLFGIVTILPFLYIIAGSFSTETELLHRSFFIIPETFSLDAYKYIFSTPTFLRSLLVSIFVTVIGTLVQLILSLLMAYPLSKKELKGRNFILNLVIFSMLFGGGMIPTYLVVKSLGLLDSLWSLILPTAINPFNLIIIKNFFQGLPAELEESARIDGCSEMGVFWKIVLPLSTPIIATFALFYAVGIWNDFYHALLYINDTSKWPLQMYLRQVTIMSDITSTGDMTEFVKPPEQAVKLAVIVLATLPIMIVYPFLQKHFTKGMLIGSVKG